MLNIIQRNEIKNIKTKKKRKEWASCPACGHGDLLIMGADYLCCSCDWSNSLMLVMSGQTDDIAFAVKEQFNLNYKLRIQKNKRLLKIF